RHLYRPLAAWAETDSGRFHQWVGVVMTGSAAVVGAVATLWWAGRPGAGWLLAVTGIAATISVVTGIRAGRGTDRAQSGGHRSGSGAGRGGRPPGGGSGRGGLRPPVAADQSVGRTVVLECRVARRLQLRDDPLGEHLAEFHPPLVERVEPPDHALGEH